MLRNQLSICIRETSEKLGYHFYEGFEYRIAENTLKFPAAWLYPPKANRAEGRQECEITYRVVLQLMHPNRKYDETAKNRVWDAMEQDALQIVNRMIPMDNVFCTGNISMTPAECSLTRSGELSLKTEFDVRMYGRPTEKLILA